MGASESPAAPNPAGRSYSEYVDLGQMNEDNRLDVPDSFLILASGNGFSDTSRLAAPRIAVAWQSGRLVGVRRVRRGDAAWVAGIFRVAIEVSRLPGLRAARFDPMDRSLPERSRPARAGLAELSRLLGRKAARSAEPPTSVSETAYRSGPTPRPNRSRRRRDGVRSIAFQFNGLRMARMDSESS